MISEMVRSCGADFGGPMTTANGRHAPRREIAVYSRSAILFILDPPCGASGLLELISC
jgi:hypothetical protein